MAQPTAPQQGSNQPAEKTAIRPFQVNVPAATVRRLARYWATEYDWRKVEARLN